MTINITPKAKASASESPEEVRHAICDWDHGRGAGGPGEIDPIDAVGDDAAEGCSEQRLSCEQHTRALQANTNTNTHTHKPTHNELRVSA
jgi:hypothetical protein